MNSSPAAIHISLLLYLKEEGKTRIWLQAETDMNNNIL